MKELEGKVGGNLEYSSEVQAVCDYCGPTDLFQWDRKPLSREARRSRPLLRRQAGCSRRR